MLYASKLYLRAEALVHNKLGNTRVRDLVPDPNDFVPMKWRFKWTGPHLVKERKGERAYVIIIWHSQRHKELIVHVDDLRTHDTIYRTSDVIEAFARAALADPALMLVLGGDGRCVVIGGVV